MSSTPTEAADSSFEMAVSEVLTRLRTALAEIVAAVPGEVAKGVDLHRALRIDRKLSWQVYKLANAPDPVAAGPHVPSRTNLNTFFKAAARHGVSAAQIEAAARVAADFEEVVAKHAGDRATFDSMVSALADDESAEQIDLAHRRLTFRGQRHTLGVQARTKLKFLVIQPAATSKMLDIAGTEGFIALRRLRGDADLRISTSGATNDDGSFRRLDREPLDPATGSSGMALLRDFCSEPLPQFRAIDAGSGMTEAELIATGVGKRAAVTCLEGHIARAAVPRFRDERNRLAHFMTRTHTPCEVQLVDLLIREDTFGPLSPTVSVHSEHRRRMFASSCPSGAPLPVHAAVMHLGKGPSVLHTPDVPRYPEMGRYVFDRLGWDGNRFDVYRCRIEYPVVQFALPEPPGD